MAAHISEPFRFRPSTPRSRRTHRTGSSPSTRSATPTSIASGSAFTAAARERGARRISRRPGALHDPRPGTAGTPPTLALLGVTAVAIHPGGPADTPLQPRDPAARRLSAGRTFPRRLLVWAVVAPPAPALVTFPSGFAAPRLVAGKVVGYRWSPFRGGAARAEGQSCRRRSPRLRRDRPERRAAVPHPGRTGGAPVHVQQVDALRRHRRRPARRVPARAQGRSAPTSEADAVVLSQLRVEPLGHCGATRDSSSGDPASDTKPAPEVATMTPEGDAAASAVLRRNVPAPRGSRATRPSSSRRERAFSPSPSRRSVLTRCTRHGRSR